MLGIYEQPVKSAGPGDGGDIHGAGLTQPHAEGQSARLKPGLGAIDLFFHFDSLSLRSIQTGAIHGASRSEAIVSPWLPR